ncbi:pentapeptide repeat-containing protein [Epibacterium ulvae]|uniref:pentapeptide repeat-containing protein n=1 Tax=Epibacterium ulvae TaxID=1156985 RepID=UPI0024934D8C|nr:pentapeptide repeat-containing protein [Epibacterium ulvae]
MTQIPLPPYEFWSMLWLMLGTFFLMPIVILISNQKEVANKLRASLGISPDIPDFFMYLAGTIWVTLIALLTIGLGLSIFGFLKSMPPINEADVREFRFYLVKLAALTATTGGIIALPISLVRLRLNREANETTEQGLITDRINKAIEGLGAEKTRKIDEKERTEPNIEVRIGSILALERIARQNLDFHIQIMEILCAYVRQNAPVDLKPAPEKPRIDIQMVMTVLGNRGKEQIGLERNTVSISSPRGYRLDLRNCNITKADISGLDFAYTDFSNSVLNKVRGTYAKFQCAIFDQTKLIDAALYDSNFTAAVFVQADLSKADYHYAIVDYALFMSVKMPTDCYNQAFHSTNNAAFYFSDIGDGSDINNQFVETLGGAVIRYKSNEDTGCIPQVTILKSENIPNFLASLEQHYKGQSEILKYDTIGEFQRRYDGHQNK